MQTFSLNDVIILKKGHPCGENRWKVIRLGADIKLQCLGCKRIVMIDRPTLQKRIKKVITNEL